MMMLALRGAQQKSLTFSSSQTWVAPAGRTLLAARGFGARGKNASSGTNYTYSQHKTTNKLRRSDGVVVVVDGGTTNKSGIAPGNYCDAFIDTPSDPIYEGTRTCYAFTDTSTDYDSPATRGASSTGFGKTFIGSLGDTAQNITTYTDIPVIPGTAYSIVIPAGGSITITWTE